MREQLQPLHVGVRIVHVPRDIALIYLAWAPLSVLQRAGSVSKDRESAASDIAPQREECSYPEESMESLIMDMMQSLEIPAGRIATVLQMIPVGIEHYVVAKNLNGFSYINVRTDDHGLVRRLMEAGRA
jgi:hypothetical protein